MRQSIIRAIFGVLFFFLFKYLITPGNNPLLHAFFALYVLEGAIYWVLFKINLPESSPK